MKVELEGRVSEKRHFFVSAIHRQPITFSLRGVIAGWTEGLQLMSVGSKYKFYVPYQIGYGAFDYGPIPGGSTLIFEIELLAIKKVPATNIKTGN